MELFYIWLQCIKGLGPLSWHHMLYEYGEPEMIYRDRYFLEPKGTVKARQIELLRQTADAAYDEANRILERCSKLGISIITYHDPKFHENIRDIDDFPILFYYKGNIRDDWTNGIGIVGARRCSREGKECAIRTATEMVHKGFPVISGMAKGIDSYAHTSAIKNNGYTIAVLGYGLDFCYPAEHAPLMEKISENGLLISEYPPGIPPSGFNFPKRNRIIAGLSDVLYVIDVGKRSGTDSTVEAAKRYGNKVVEGVS